MERDELVFFESLIKLNQCKRVVEIGVWLGESTKHLCKALAYTNGHLWGFDIWEIHGLKKQYRMISSKEKVEQRLKDAGIPENLYTLTKIDTKIDRELFENFLEAECAPIDFCFIDGCHSYEGIKNDFFSIYPLLSPVSIVAFHDTLRIDGCREFILDLRDKYWDGTYDIVDFPYGGGKRRVGISLLIKRCYHKINISMDEVCNLEDTRDQIIKKEADWYRKQER